MGLAKSIKKRIDWITKVQFDKQTGFYRYFNYGQPIYIRHKRHFVSRDKTEWVCEKLYFHHYLPGSGDTIVDLGAGYSEEGVYANEKSSGFRYIGVEIQPIIYECLCNTFKHLGESFIASPFLITNSEDKIKVISQFSYASSGTQDVGYIEVPTISWDAFLSRYQIETIDLLKMNIEGAEIDILEQITDFSIVKRFAISCHDFRANNNEGEQYRTKERVLKKLNEGGYTIKTFDYGISWANDWIYAERL